MINDDCYNPYAERFKKRWEEVTTKLNNSGYDLSKINLVMEGFSHVTRPDKRDS